MTRPPIGVPGRSGAEAPLLSQRWHTVSPSHAIQRAAAILTFPEELPSFVVNRMVSAVRPVATALGLRNEEAVNSVTVQIGPGGAQEASPSVQDGTSFQDVRGGQVVGGLNVTKQAIRFETANYTRWVAFRDQFSHILEAVLPILAHSTTIQSIGLEYVDFFYAAAEGAEDAGLIIDNQSQLVARRAFRRRDPFHTHSGWFDDISSQSRRLVNVDLTVADAKGPVGLRRTVTIRTFEAEQITDMNSTRALELAGPDAVLRGLDAIHNSLKERLGHLLTRDAKKMISLGS